MTPFYKAILENIDRLPDTANIPLPIAELIAGVSRRTIKRTFPLVKLSEHREGVPLGYLRSRKDSTAT